MEVGIVEFKRDVKNTRKGYFTLVLRGLLIKKCVAHKHPAGKVWFAPPAIQRQDGGYENVVCFANPDENQSAQQKVAELLAPHLKDE